MSWLTRLLGVDTPPNTTLQSAELSFRGWLPFWLVLFLILALTAVSILLYFRERGRISTWLKLVMASLRTILLIFLLLLLLRPVLLAEFSGQRPRSILLLLDNSESMQQADKRFSIADRIRVAIARGQLPPQTSISDTVALADIGSEGAKDPSRISLLKSVLGNEQLHLLEDLGKRGPLRPYLFGGKLSSFVKERSPEGETPSLGEQLGLRLDANQPQTALTDALMGFLQRKDRELPAVVVIMTDGRDNASKFLLSEAAEEFSRANIPLHVYGVGSREGGTLQLLDLTVPETIFYDDTMTVPLRWRAQGFKKGSFQIKLMLGGKLVASKEVSAAEGQDLRTELSFIPDQKQFGAKEKMDLTASIQLKGNDLFKDQLSRPVRLSDRKVRILYIENTPRWEYKFLQPALLRDRRVEVRFLLLQGDARLLQSGPPFLAGFPKREELLKYDLIILGDIPTVNLGKKNLELIREYVRDFKGGLVVIAGRSHAPSSFVNTPLEEVLPVEILPYTFKMDPNQRPEPYKPKLTKAGEVSQMLALADTQEENLKIWNSLPGFYWNYPVTRLRPAATALLIHPRKIPGQQPVPILAVHYYGKGQVLFLGTDETWRWRYNSEEKYFTRFWGQIIYQLALPHLLGDASNRLVGALERSEALLDRPGSVYLRILDTEYRPRKDREVQADLVSLDAKAGGRQVRKINLQSLPGRPGEYRAYLQHDVAGRFEIRVPGIASPFSYQVSRPPFHEQEEVGMAEEALQHLARSSGGRFYREEDLYQLAEDIQPQLASFTLRQEILLWNPLVFLLFLVLITSEWILRKFSNLS